MNKHLHSIKYLFFTIITLSVSTSFAQKGFDTKKRNEVNNSKPAGQFVEVKREPERNARQATFAAELSTKITKLKVTRDSETGSVLMIENLAKSNPNARVSIQTQASTFLSEAKKLLKIENPAQELEMISMENDEQGKTHIRLQQKFNNIPIYGGEMWLHSNGEKIETLNGRNFPTPNLSSTTPSFSEEKAIDFAMQDVRKYAIVQQNGVMGKLLKQKDNSAELIIYHKDDKPDNEHLAYHLTIKPNMLERWVYFIDAQSGEVLDKYNYTCALDGPLKATASDLNGVSRSFGVYQVGSFAYMIDSQRPMFNKTASKIPDDPVGVIWTIDAKNSTVDNTEYQHVTSSNNTNWSATAVSAHYNAGICYDFYRTKFSRNSLDDKGSSIVSVINITDEDGKGFDNAFWNGEYMAYGNGATAFKPLAGALDVAGHEMTHGVVEATARLEYRNQSGALNESFADIFGAMIDRDDWRIGEDVTRTSFIPTGALRSLENPNQGGKGTRGYQPKTMSQYAYMQDTEEEDNGGVHVNSGIPNYTFYLFASNQNVGKDKAEQVYYKALKQYLFRTAKFVDARLAVVKAATDLYGASSAEVTAAKAAFDAVGIADPSGSSSGGSTTPSPTTQTIPTNTGGDFILVYEPSTKTLYTGKSTDQNFKPISSKGCLSKPSVQDDGLFAYFVGADKNIYRIALSGSYTETKLTSDAFWGNVAVSKDGKRLAARANAQEKFIYVFDLENNGKGYKLPQLYNPTYSTGVKSGDVVYPDALEWDYSGEYVIYDVFNKLKSTTGTLEYWDVGLIKAWDLAKKTVGGGQIEKLFTDLEKGESIGNPSFSKNSPSILAFDYFHELEYPDSYFQIAVDIESGDLDGVYENTDVGYPGYTRLDDKMLFNSKSSGKEVVMTINLDKNKLTPVGKASVLFDDAKWAVWYSQGQRALPTKTTQTITFDGIADRSINQTFSLSAKASSNLAVQYTIESGDASIINNNQLRTGTTAGKVSVKAFQTGNNQYASASATQTFCIVPATPTIASNNGNLVASGATTYQWYVNGNPVGGQTTSNTRKPDFNGNWTVRAVTNDGCESAASNAINVVSAILANEPNSEIQITAYPNPTSDNLKLDLPTGVTFKEATFFTTDGKEIMKVNRLQENNMLNVSQLQKAIYHISIETTKGKVVRKVVLE